MATRISHADVHEAYLTLCNMLGKSPGSKVGDWRLRHSSGGRYVLEEIISTTGYKVSQPFGEHSWTDRELIDHVEFTLRALEIKESNRRR